MSQAFPVFRPLDIQDLEQVVGIESEAYDDPWSRELLSQSLGAPMTYTLARFEGSICQAYAIYQVVFSDAHLLNLAVAPKHQRQGLGNDLLSRIAQDCFRRGAHSFFLEVRPSNLAAIKLYQKNGFRKLMVREKYYPNGEAAFVMIADLPIHSEAKL